MTMTNADMPAMAQPVTLDAYGDITVASVHDTDYMGLTKREHFAGLAMQGMLAYYGNVDADNCASYAVEYTNALLKALEVSDAKTT
jgi:hypothetical protein